MRGPDGTIGFGSSNVNVWEGMPGLSPGYNNYVYDEADLRIRYQLYHDYGVLGKSLYNIESGGQFEPLDITNYWDTYGNLGSIRMLADGLEMGVGLAAGAQGGNALAGQVGASRFGFSAPPVPKHSFKAPLTARHSASRISLKSIAKEKNTVFTKSVAKDVEAINYGNYKLVHGRYNLPNGRVYGEHGGRLYPIEGPGFTSLDRGAFKALGIFNKFGNTPRASNILNNMKINDVQRNAALKVFNEL